MTSCPIQQRHTPGQAEGNAQRALVSRRQHRHAGVWPGGNTGVNIHPFFINRHWDNLHSGGAKQRLGNRITRVFQPDRLSRLQQRVDHQLYQSLITRADKYLLRPTNNATGKVQVMDDCLAQFRQAIRWWVCQ
ncbi:hypothetical protein D3C75_770550 [compost metagenome]